ncbi:hypothetical protein M8C21_030468 [Ambrosia artemisiifolia]|uniref:Uncharacterized protein n=1 Tax=Ambrosia artemisiifolia TaxID=4212 RepID=A0AAD5CHF9_AMBAR|nr:hypothetical protein M8C21_030468 [Ambrosia artemisiifolia]
MDFKLEREETRGGRQVVTGYYTQKCLIAKKPDSLHEPSGNWNGNTYGCSIYLPFSDLEASVNRYLLIYLLSQLVQNGKRVQMMGVDTWTQLFTHHFNKSYPYPSFKDKDPNMVDNGCISHQIPVLIVMVNIPYLSKIVKAYAQGKIDL